MHKIEFCVVTDRDRRSVHSGGSNVIRESLSPYNSPLLLVPKKDGSWHLVIDYRKLNKQTVPDRLPMPHFEEALTQLSGLRFSSHSIFFRDIIRFL